MAQSLSRPTKKLKKSELLSIAE